MTFSWTPHRFSGGALALDVANSVVLRSDPARRIDRFAEPATMDAFPEGANRHGAATATLASSSYEAEPTPDGTLAFTLRAQFEGGEEVPRIGLRGTAKVYGERSSLFMFLFRRPLSALRQGLGL